MESQIWKWQRPAVLSNERKTTKAIPTLQSWDGSQHFWNNNFTDSYNLRMLQAQLSSHQECLGNAKFL